MLGLRFEGGVDLSGGEWQKIALARAYVRDAQLVILDEPTASLDARSEYEVFQRFAELTAGKMALLISHRFSTVRMADRIVVLENGRIAEQGSHAQLLSLGGRYSAMFELQACKLSMKHENVLLQEPPDGATEPDLHKWHSAGAALSRRHPGSRPRARKKRSPPRSPQTRSRAGGSRRGPPRK